MKHYLFLRRFPPSKGEWGGLEKLMFDWLERVDYQKTSITVCVTLGWAERFLAEAKQRHLFINVIEAPFQIKDRGFKRFSVLWKATKNLKLDGAVLFQAHHAEFHIAELLLAWLKTRGRVFMHENLGATKPLELKNKRYLGIIPALGLWWHYQRWLISSRSLLSRKIIAVSKEIKNRYVTWWNYSPSRIDVFYHGVDVKKFSPSAQTRLQLRAKLHIDPSDVVIITTSRFTQQKRLDRVIEAFDVVSRKFRNLRLLMAGNGPLEADIKALAHSKASKNQITFLGQVKDTSDYLKISDIFVLCSDNEGLSLALLEAMATGLICLSTDCTGSDEAITSFHTGFIVEKSVDGVEQGLREILSLSASQREKMSQDAVDFVRMNFEINSNINKVFKTIGLQK